MINLGEYNTLKVHSESEFGLYLSDENGEQILLPNKYVPKSFKIGEDIKVFVLNDSEDRYVATTESPKVVVNEFALLKVTDVNQYGAFMDWGMEKDLMVPFREQKDKMEESRWYVVYVGVDNETNRLFASSKVSSYLQNQYLSVQENDKVDILIYKKTDLGYSVIVNDEHSGLVFESDVFQTLNVGDRLEAYVKNIREDNKLDIALQPVGYDKFISKASEEVYRTLEENDGFLAITDKSSPELIYEEFSMSKKAFKKALGDLYKQRKISLSEEGIRII